MCVPGDPLLPAVTVPHTSVGTLGTHPSDRTSIAGFSPRSGSPQPSLCSCPTQGQPAQTPRASGPAHSADVSGQGLGFSSAAAPVPMAKAWPQRGPGFSWECEQQRGGCGSHREPSPPSVHSSLQVPAGHAAHPETILPWQDSPPGNSCSHGVALPWPPECALRSSLP
uniref:Uncharacterized protein n=1 Tax=Molossus molossus TaxID=27622 RepID=A0A7J8HC64_MOLMO|nr:hypothetical protein HJG59_011215 [Molossus molossus]